ncbi:hypothetical protein EVJ58_g4811 [Rhodofomes roseus]|uniref:protein-L-isoaspartate(D-aspartate) O-methyltransferase n=1 Tax=Rhodofomes roseus TaxID=34475 RepID=A0A4Y9YG30_9APHY|nr:hypothetical protein EVJ58_g4811 [Rhodofomes roseus]
MAKHGLINSERVQAAMKRVDRANYVRNPHEAYEDSPQRIGHGATISAPHMHAHAVEYLLPLLHPGARVLDVGSGSGYLCGVLHYLVTDLDSGGPYDAIHVGAAAPTMPQALVDQLARPGRMFIPVGEEAQAIIQVDKDVDGNVTQKELFDVMYVPLTDQEKQRTAGL